MIYYISGGQRSGKSSYAEELALSLSDTPVYLATSRIWDADFADRVKRHQDGRGDNWTNIEEEIKLSNVDVIGRVVMIDCVTLWLTNLFFDSKDVTVDAIVEQAKLEFDAFVEQDATFIFISNEIGMGGHAANEVGRKFTDLQGWVNQHIAKRADHVTLMVSGLPLVVKQ